MYPYARMFLMGSRMLNLHEQLAKNSTVVLRRNTKRIIPNTLFLKQKEPQPHADTSDTFQEKARVAYCWRRAALQAYLSQKPWSLHTLLMQIVVEQVSALSSWTVLGNVVLQNTTHSFCTLSFKAVALESKFSGSPFLHVKCSNRRTALLTQKDFCVFRVWLSSIRDIRKQQQKLMILDNSKFKWNSFNYFWIQRN